ncbi:MAG: response regulator [Holophaga sp.]|nr:response regulator [Holophaga sp.]
MNAIDPPRRQTILVVDDTPDNVILLLGFLKGVFRVKVAPTGLKALEVAGSAEPPDLILLDVMMPEMDGYEVCRILKGDARTREIPVIFLTSKGESNDEARGFALGCADYITKPFSPALVLARVRTHLEQRRLLAVEKELLEKTLNGALAVILEMISLADPHASEWSQRLTELAERVARSLGMKEPWMVGLAGALSRIGTLTVPKNVLAKVQAKMILNSEERQAYARVPEVGYRLLRSIPRLESVAEMVYFSQKNFNGGGFPVDSLVGDEIPLGGRILRVCLDFMNESSVHKTPQQRVSDMLCNLTLYDQEVVFALKRIIDGGFFAADDRDGEIQFRDVAIAELMEGDVLDSSIETKDGQVLLRQGTLLRTSHLEKLVNFELTGAIEGPISIRVDA